MPRKSCPSCPKNVTEVLWTSVQSLGILRIVKERTQMAERLHSVKRLIAALAHVHRLKGNGSTRFGEVMQADEHATDLALTARLRILYFAFAALGKGQS